MSKQFEELSRPVAEIKCHEDMTLSVVNVSDGFSLGRHPVYSQEYVTALQEALEEKNQKNAWLKEQLAQLANFNPDWDMLKAAQDSLREHVALIKEKDQRISELLAAREAQGVPVAWQERWSGGEWSSCTKSMFDYMTANPEPIAEVRQLYAVPPAPAVPDELLDAMDEVIRISDRDHEAWNRAKSAISVYRAAIQNHVGDTAEKVELVSSCYKLVPRKLTAENGAKSALISEFTEIAYIHCTECLGDDDCETCDGTGRIAVHVPVSWTTIKAIWSKAIEHFDSVTTRPGTFPQSIND